MNSFDRASFCDPKNRKGRIIVGGTATVFAGDEACSDVLMDAGEESFASQPFDKTEQGANESQAVGSPKFRNHT